MTSDMASSLALHRTPMASWRALVDSVGNEFKHVVDVDDRFRFEFLKSSTYTLTVGRWL